MEWSRESFEGRVTVLAGLAVAGVTESGHAFVCGLGLEHDGCIQEEIELDSAGCSGLAGLMTPS
jgi:hypothetical protein